MTDTCLNNCLHHLGESNIDIRIRFAKALEHPLTILTIATYDNLITINPDKSIALDYSV